MTTDEPTEPVAYTSSGEPKEDAEAAEDTEVPDADTNADGHADEKDGPGIIGRILGVGAGKEGVVDSDSEGETDEVSSSDEPPEAASGETVDVNHATFEDLRDLGFSVTQATRVITYREQQSGFKTIDDLAAVPGMPREFLTEIRPRLTVT